MGNGGNKIWKRFPLNMKTLLNCIAFVFFLTLIGCNESVKETRASESDSAEVVLTVTALDKAIIDRDGLALDNLTDDGLTYGHSSGRIEDKAQFIDAIVNGSFVFNTIERTDQSVSVHDNIAVVRHVFNAKATNDGVPVDIRIGNILIFQNKDGVWKLLARQAYKL